MCGWFRVGEGVKEGVKRREEKGEGEDRMSGRIRERTSNLHTREDEHLHTQEDKQVGNHEDKTAPGHDHPREIRHKNNFHHEYPSHLLPRKRSLKARKLSSPIIHDDIQVAAILFAVTPASWLEEIRPWQQRWQILQHTESRSYSKKI